MPIADDLSISGDVLNVLCLKPVSSPTGVDGKDGRSRMHCAKNTFVLIRQQGGCGTLGPIRGLL